MSMTFWQFNTIICVIDIILYCLCVLRGMHLLKTRYPGMKWLRTSHWSATVMSVLKMVLYSVCPFFNLYFLYILMTKDTKIIEYAVEETYQNQMRFQQKMEDN